MTVNFFHAYSEKSKARRALVQVYKVAKDVTEIYICQGEDKRWGFYLDPMGNPYPARMAANENAAEQAIAQTLAAETQAATEEKQPPVEEETDHVDHMVGTSSASALGSFALAQLTQNNVESQVQQPEAKDTTRRTQRVAGVKIERQREERNGIKMPSAGGMCRAVWDELTSLLRHNEESGLADVPTLAAIKKIAEEKGWNVNNASIEYYQWRRFHGIVGRGKKSI
jgi:hypothetical protein